MSSFCSCDQQTQWKQPKEEFIPITVSEVLLMVVGLHAWGQKVVLMQVYDISSSPEKRMQGMRQEAEFRYNLPRHTPSDLLPLVGPHLFSFYTLPR